MMKAWEIRKDWYEALLCAFDFRDPDERAMMHQYDDLLLALTQEESEGIGLVVKEFWQTPNDIGKYGKFEHRASILWAMRNGIAVDREILMDYVGEFWADEALAGRVLLRRQ
jgi:hypothetical protein